MRALIFSSVITGCMALSAAAQANCIEFRESSSGDATLINHCDAEMDVGYWVTPAGEAPRSDARLYRSNVPPSGTRMIWSSGNAPVEGRYEINVLSCMAPTSLHYVAGSKPTCQIDVGSQG